ncbi:barstar family protein [Streptomyces fradiae]|uniref:barstar family protein n=1 Tax=Streptomyces fradiae TaxID=1906 RepID=UPI003518FCCC
MHLSNGLTVISPAEVQEVLSEAVRQEVPVFVLTTGGQADRDSFFREVRKALPLDPPLSSSRSWDALSDSLWEGLRLHSSQRMVILWGDAGPRDSRTEEEFRIALEVLRDVAETLSDPVITNSRPKQLSVYVATEPSSGSMDGATETPT